MDFQQYYDTRKKLVNNFLEKRMEKRGISNVDDAMKYSLLAGGKRLRPILLMATAEAVGANGYDFLPAACGLEMIHTYSLIHDDLPCMDNDDYRRGRLTNHKVLGRQWRLAGDGLLTLAFEVMLEQRNVKPSTLVEVVHETAMCAGNFGMVGGQALDLDAENRQITAKELKTLHEGKTTPCSSQPCGAPFGGSYGRTALALTRFAELIGLAFQIEDDILDAGPVSRKNWANPLAATRKTTSQPMFLFSDWKRPGRWQMKRQKKLWPAWIPLEKKQKPCGKSLS